MEAKTYASAIGEFVRTYRRGHAITLEAVARRGREHGATWSLSSVQAIEAGKASPTLPTMLTLALVLGDLGGEPLTLVDLLGEAEVFDRPYADRSEQPVKRSFVARALAGSKVELTTADIALWDDAPFGPSSGGDRRIGQLEDRQRDFVVDEELDDAVRRLGGGPLSAAELAGAHAQMVDEYQMPPEPDWDEGDDLPPSQAEQRAAKKLEMDPGELQRIAEDLWGHTLEEESTHRAGSDSTPQARGRVTRLLVDEIRTAVEEEH